jgi:hypothetical protein
MSGSSCAAGTAFLSITRSAIASRLMAIESALRTRASRNGFLSSGLPSLAVTNGGALSLH